MGVTHREASWGEHSGVAPVIPLHPVHASATARPMGARVSKLLRKRDGWRGRGLVFGREFCRFRLIPEKK